MPNIDGREDNETLSDSEFSTLRISDPRIDVRARLFRECVAMVQFIGSRGIPTSDNVLKQVNLLDAGIQSRDLIPLSTLIGLHDELSKVVSPALPESIELLQWEARRHPRLSWIAPLDSVRILLGMSLVFVLTFCAVLILGGLSDKDIADSIFDANTEIERTIPAADGQPEKKEMVKVADNSKRAVLLVYFLSLAGLGAAFATLYDARRQIVDGRYDARTGSNYTVRIILGLIAGLLLSQILSNPIVPSGSENNFAAEDPFTSVSKSMLALVGGFSAKFLYTALSRMVEALEGMFKPGEVLEQYVKLQQQQLEEAKKENLAASQKNAKITQLASLLAQAETEAERQKIVQSMFPVLSDTEEEVVLPADVAADQQNSAEKQLADVEKELEVKTELALMLPEAEATEVVKKIEELKAEADDLKASGGKLLNAENVARVIRLASAAKLVNPPALLIGTGLNILTEILGKQQSGKLPGLLKLMINAGKTLDDDTFGKWKDILLRASDKKGNQNLEESILKTVQGVFESIPIVGDLLGVLSNKKKASKENIISTVLDQIFKGEKRTQVDEIKKLALVNTDEADEMVETLLSIIIGETELGSAAKERLIDGVDLDASSAETLIAFARRAVGSGTEGQAVIERLLTIADAVVEKSHPISEVEVLNILKDLVKGE